MISMSELTSADGALGYYGSALSKGQDQTQEGGGGAEHTAQVTLDRGEAFHAEGGKEGAGHIQKQEKSIAEQTGKATAEKFKNQSGKIDNYYLDEQAPAVWAGKGAQLLGIAGQNPTREQLKNFLEGKITNPVTGELEDLSKNSKGDKRRIGYDLTFSPPKSISVMAYIGEDDRLIEAIRKANTSVMGWLEQNASTIRVSDKNGVGQKIDGFNVLRMEVQHATSRDNDPQGHIHNVFLPFVFDASAQKYRSLTNDELMIWRMPSDSIGMGQLRVEVERLGYETVASEDGKSWEIKGVPAEILQEYSGRSKAVETWLKSNGIDPESASYHQRAFANLETRQMKQELPKEMLVSDWNKRAETLGFNYEELKNQSLIRAESINDLNFEKSQKIKAHEAVTLAVTSLSEREQAFSVKALEVEAAKFLSVRNEDVKEAIASQIDRKSLINVEITGSTKYLTTQQAITVEKELIQYFKNGIGQGVPILTKNSEFERLRDQFEEQKGFRLTAEQINASRNDLMHPDLIQVTQGDAGTGKTAAKEFVRFVVDQNKELNIIGLATTGAAAQELQNASGIESMTLAKFFNTAQVQRLAAENEIKTLVQAIKNNELIRNSEALRVEKKKLEVKSFDLNFGKNSYAFDHARGDVWRIGGGVVSNFGSRLMELGSVGEGAQAKGQNQSLYSSLLAGVVSRGREIAYSIGTKLTKLEKVSDIETIIAKASLFHSEDHQKGELGTQLSALKKQSAILENIDKTGNKEGRKTVLVLDESSMTGSKDAERLLSVVKSGWVSRFLIQGDTKQLPSVAAGRFMHQLKASGVNVSHIEQTKRFDNATPQAKEALQHAKSQNWKQAIQVLDKHLYDDAKFTLGEAVAERYIQNVKELEKTGVSTEEAIVKVGIITTTNSSRHEANKETHNALLKEGYIGQIGFEKGHLDNSNGLSKTQTKMVKFLHSKDINRIIFNKTYKEIGVKRNDIISVVKYDHEKNRIEGVNELGRKVFINPRAQDLFIAAKFDTKEYSVGEKIEARFQFKTKDQAGNEVNIPNATLGKIVDVNKDKTTVKWQNAGNSVTELDNKVVQKIDYAYDHTTTKEQGKTNLVEIVGVAEKDLRNMSKEMLYVNITRAKHNTEFVTNSLEALLNTIPKDASKTTSTDFGIDISNKYQIGAKRETQMSGMYDILAHKDNPQSSALVRSQQIQISVTQQGDPANNLNAGKANSLELSQLILKK